MGCFRQLCGISRQEGGQIVKKLRVTIQHAAKNAFEQGGLTGLPRASEDDSFPLKQLLPDLLF